jgi:ATP-dependent DNA helicase MPH1
VIKVSIRAKKTTPAKGRQILKAPKQLKRLKISKASRPIFDSSDMESDGEESDSELPRRQKSGAISVSGDNSEGEGESLLRSEDRSEDSELDDVGSLKDFLASEDHLMGTGDISMVRSSTSPPPTGPQSMRKGFVIPAPLPSTQDTNVDDDDFPPLGELTEAPAKQNPVLTLDEGQSDEDMRPVSRHREKRRRVVDSDSDE